MQAIQIYTPFVSIRKVAGDDGEDTARLVYGIVTDTSLDIDQQRCDGAWLRSALPEWLNTFANVREMHQPSAVGKGIDLTNEGDQWFLTARIVDPAAMRKIDEGVYSGFSIGVKWPKVVRDNSAPMGLITGGHIVEVSVVDRPANGNAKFALVKSALAEDDAEEPAEKAAIPHKEGEPKSPPKGYPSSVDTAHYADPANHSWPIDSKPRIRSAMAYYNGGKGKDKYSGDEWGTVGRRIARAAADAFGKSCTLADGKIECNDDSGDKLAVLAEEHFAPLLVKGEPNQEQANLFQMLKLYELDDAQLCLLTANFVRYLMIRRLHEQAEPTQSMQDYMLTLGGMYDQLLYLAQNEYNEAFSYQAGQIIQQLLTSHTLELNIEDAQIGVQQMAPATADTRGNALGGREKGVEPDVVKYGAEYSAKNYQHIQNAHDSLQKATAGAVCKVAGPVPPPQDASKNGGIDMDAGELEAMMKTVQADTAAQVAAAVSAALGDGSPMGTQLGEVLTAVKDLGERLAAVEERASDSGPLMTAYKRQRTSDADDEVARIDREIADLTKVAEHHSDAMVRSNALLKRNRLAEKRVALVSGLRLVP